MTDNWTPKTGKVIDSWTPKTGSIVSDEPITETKLQQPSFLRQLGQSFINTGKAVVNPPYRIAAHALQGLEQLIPGRQGTIYTNPITGDVVKPYTQETPLSEPIGLGLQGAAFFGSPTLAGAMFGGGGALEEGKTPIEVASSTLIGATLGRTMGVVSGKEKVPFIGTYKKVKGAFKFIPKTTEKEVGLARTVRSEALKSKLDASNEFGDSLENLAKQNPNRTVSLRETVNEINLDPELSIEARNVFNKTPVLRDLLKNPDLADNVSLRNTQEIINYINTKVPANIKSNHLDILEHLGDIRASQLDAFPNMSGVRQAYANVKTNYNLIKPGLKAGNLLENLAKNWKDAELKEAFYSLIKNPNTLESIKNYQTSLKILKTAGLLTKTAAVGSVGAGTYGILKSALETK